MESSVSRPNTVNKLRFGVDGAFAMLAFDLHYSRTDRLVSFLIEFTVRCHDTPPFSVDIL